MSVMDFDAVVHALVFLSWITRYGADSDSIKRPWSPPLEPGHAITCSPWNQSGCASGTCCVKEVITFKDYDENLVVRTHCKPLLTVGELCLRQPEGYLCDCGKGLHCSYQRNETYGHCTSDKG